MKRVTQILLRAYLRRNPVRFRLSQFNFLSKYSWLKNVLEDLQPELFPKTLETDSATPSSTTVEDIPAGFRHPLEGKEIKGDRDIYEIGIFKGQRGNGLLFEGQQLEAPKAVTIRVYILEPSRFNPREAQRRQREFRGSASLNLADERMHDFRVLCPIEAIANPPENSEDGVDYCFLITDQQDINPTVAAKIANGEKLPPDKVRLTLKQILQTLSLLHQQRYLFPSGGIQDGIVHGNLSLDSWLQVKHGNHNFVYLTDLHLWEQCTRPPNQPPPDLTVKPETVAKELRQVGLIGLSLLQGQVIANVSDAEAVVGAQNDTALTKFIQQLLHEEASSEAFSKKASKRAEVAWQILLSLGAPQQSPATTAESIEAVAQIKRRSPCWSTLLGLTALMCLGGFLWALWLRPSTVADESQEPMTCCLDAISAVPAGTYTYAFVEDGTWDYVLQQNHLLQRGQTLMMALDKARPEINPEEENQPELKLNPLVSSSIEDAIVQLQLGKADFAILPITQSLPIDLDYQVIAYDALAVVVAFNYAERDQGLPQTLEGEILLAAVRSLYDGRTLRWDELGGADLSVQRYAVTNPEAQHFFEQAVLQGSRLERLTTNRDTSAIVECKHSLGMLQQIIRDFESGFNQETKDCKAVGPGPVLETQQDKDIQQLGSIGFAPLSEIVGQCSVYPLALSENDQPAVQPLMLDSGKPITPNTDLCRRKGAYQPNSLALRAGDYPLAYPIGVVYSRDNSRSAISAKFAEMLTTQEGQILLAEAGLVPIQSVFSTIRP